MDLVAAMKARGHEPHVISNGGVLVSRLQALGIPHTSLPVHKKSLLAALRVVPQLVRYIRRHGIEVVHARSRVPAWSGSLACRITGTKFLTTCHGYYTTHLFSRVMGWGRLVIVPSHIIGRHMIADFRVPAARIRHIPRGVDLMQFQYRAPAETLPNTLRVALIGRLTSLKGHVIFFKAIARLIRLVPHVKCLVVGEPSDDKASYLDELQTWVRRLSLTRCVEFTGACHNIPELLQTVDLVVVPSTHPESFGRVVIEAQAAGVPVIASRVGGLAEIVEDEQTGLLVPPEDPVTLANAMVRVLTDRALARRLAAAGRRAVEQRFSLTQMVEQTLAVYEELLKTTRILVIKLSALGDVVLASPSFRTIRHHFPHAKIACLVGLPARAVVQRCPYFDEIFVDDVTGKDRGWRGAIRLGHTLRRVGFDLVFDLQSSRRSRLIGWTTGAPERHGHANGKWSGLLTHQVAGADQTLPPIEHQFQFLRQCGMSPNGAHLEYWTGPEDETEATRLLRRQWLPSHQRLVALHPGGSRAWETKQWPPASWAALCDALARQRIRTVITGTRDEQAVGEAIVHATRSKPILIMGETSIGGLASLFRRCQVVVTLDTAALHVAAAVGTPVVALFGPTDPQRHAPPATHQVILWKHVSCSPCYQRHCPLLARQHMQCMTKMTVEEVASAIESLLEQTKRAPASSPTALMADPRSPAAVSPP